MGVSKDVVLATLLGGGTLHASQQAVTVPCKYTLYRRTEYDPSQLAEVGSVTESTVRSLTMPGFVDASGMKALFEGWPSGEPIALPLTTKGIAEANERELKRKGVLR